MVSFNGLDLEKGYLYEINGEIYRLTSIETRRSKMLISMEELISVTFQCGFSSYVFEEKGLIEFISKGKIKLRLRDSITPYEQYYCYWQHNITTLPKLEQTKLPRKVLFNDRKQATTILYGDKATVVKATKGDKYDRKYGFLMAYFQATCGLSKNKANKYLEEIVKDK